MGDDSTESDVVALRQEEARYGASMEAARRNRANGEPPDRVSVEATQYDELIVEARRLRIERDRFERKSRALEKCVRKLGVDTKHREAMESSVAALKSIAAHGRTWGGGVQELCEEVKTFHARLKAQEARAYETNASTYTRHVTPSKLAVALWTQDLASFATILGEPNAARPYEVNLGLVYPQEAGLQYTLAVAPGSVTMLNASTLSPSLRKVFNGRNLRALYLGEMRGSRRTRTRSQPSRRPRPCPRRRRRSVATCGGRRSARSGRRTQSSTRASLGRARGERSSGTTSSQSGTRRCRSRAASGRSPSSPRRRHRTPTSRRDEEQRGKEGGSVRGAADARRSMSKE